MECSSERLAISDLTYKSIITLGDCAPPKSAWPPPTMRTKFSHRLRIRGEEIRTNRKAVVAPEGMRGGVELHDGTDILGRRWVQNHFRPHLALVSPDPGNGRAIPNIPTARDLGGAEDGLEAAQRIRLAREVGSEEAQRRGRHVKRHVPLLPDRNSLHRCRESE